MTSAQGDHKDVRKQPEVTVPPLSVHKPDSSGRGALGEGRKKEGRLWREEGASQLSERPEDSRCVPSPPTPRFESPGVKVNFMCQQG